MDESDKSECSDLELIAAAQGGDASAMEQLLSRYYRQVYCFAYRMTGETAEAEDVTQEALVKVSRAIGSFKGQSKFSTWLYRITANTVFDLRKRSQRQARISERYGEDEALKASPAEQEAVSKEVLLALATLSEKEREAIVLTFYEGLNQAEVAKISGCAETTISWRVFMAKKKLKKFFKAQGGGV